MNKVILTGRLTRDPQVRWTQGKEQIAVARFTLAVDRRGKGCEDRQNADFPSCVLFGKKAEFAEKYLRQGTKIEITGRLQTGSYINKDGLKIYTTEVIGEDVEFAESKNASSAQSYQTNPAPAPAMDAGDGFMNIPDGVDEELPFN